MAARGGGDPAPAAFVFAGAGTGARSLLSAAQSLRAALVPGVAVEHLGAEALLAGGWERRCCLLASNGTTAGGRAERRDSAAAAAAPRCPLPSLPPSTSCPTLPHPQVMPGGADRPYCAALNGEGNRRIRAFVEAGGAYLGLCAGAYYASQRVEFELGSRCEGE